MNKVVQAPFRITSLEMIAKLIKAGYLQPARRYDADAITQAIANMKQDLRGYGSKRRRPRVPRDHAQSSCFAASTRLRTYSLRLRLLISLSLKACINNSFGLGRDRIGVTFLQIGWAIGQRTGRMRRKDRCSPALAYGAQSMRYPLYSMIGIAFPMPGPGWRRGKSKGVLSGKRVEGILIELPTPTNIARD